MAPDRPESYDEYYGPLYNRIWAELMFDQEFYERYPEELKERRRQGERLLRIEIIRRELIDRRGYTQSEIARRSRHSPGAVARLLGTEQHGGPDLIEAIFEAFQEELPKPSRRERRIAGHCNAIHYVREEILDDESIRAPLEREGFVALYFLYNSKTWVRASQMLAMAHRTNDPRRYAEAQGLYREAAMAIFEDVRAYLGCAPTGVTPEYVKALHDLVAEWGYAYLVYLPDISPD